VRTLHVDVIEGQDAGKSVEASEDTLTIGSAESNDLVLTDPTVSRFHLDLRTLESGGVRLSDLNSKNGTWLGGARLFEATVPAGAVLQLGRTKIRLSDGKQKDVAVHAAPVLSGLLGAHPAMRRLMARIQRVAPSDAVALVTGESGTGKELVARAIHDQSARAARPFVVVDCGALTPSLVASALFGHERGAFTGALKRHAGAFERANGGTVFLDEIGELPLELQPQLLGVLERKRFLSLGGSHETDVDVRIVSATNRDLRVEVNRGRFREDLYYRLAVVNLDLPPLRERLSDLPILLEHFLRETGSDLPFDAVFPAEVLDRFQQHAWPGNVRELRNVVEAAVAIGEPTLEARPDQQKFTFPPALLQGRYAAARAAVLDGFEQAYLPRLIRENDNNASRAARAAGMDRTYLLKLLQKHQLR
jgi:DNA-binding NtrC family response regulator